VYYTIAGSFREFENAIALRDKLQALGYPSEIAGKRNGLFLVSYRKYFSRSEAKSDADKLRSLGAEAWVFRYHAQKNKL
jgi:cell division protein FtsN